MIHIYNIEVHFSYFFKYVRMFKIPKIYAKCLCKHQHICLNLHDTVIDISYVAFSEIKDEVCNNIKILSY